MTTNVPVCKLKEVIEFHTRVGEQLLKRAAKTSSRKKYNKLCRQAYRHFFSAELLANPILKASR